jgi:hypothetical protein
MMAAVNGLPKTSPKNSTVAVLFSWLKPLILHRPNNPWLIFWRHDMHHKGHFVTYDSLTSKNNPYATVLVVVDNEFSVVIESQSLTRKYQG